MSSNLECDTILDPYNYYESKKFIEIRDYLYSLTKGSIID